MKTKNSITTTNNTVFSMLILLSMAHCMNDIMQAVITSSYPFIKNELGITFTKIGLITLVYQIAASVFQPCLGFFFDRYPIPYSLPIGMSFTMIGLFSLGLAPSFYWVLCSVFFVGIGSSVLHPEASRITSLVSGGKRGLAQSIFQVGGNFGTSMGPLAVAIIVAPYGKKNISFFAIVAFIAILFMIPVCKWYKKYLNNKKLEQNISVKIVKKIEMPLPMKQTVFSIVILMILIFSKYVYMASLSSYYTFYLMQRFYLSIQLSQIFLFVFLVAMAIGTI
ncbi:MAG: MFS transporter, partial [Elusimicrobiota bacterium]|nr:MFS transporter [Elusimicrobiota bacterium]